MDPKKRSAAALRREFEEMAIPQMDCLLRVAVRMTGNRQEAQDLVQETFLKAYKAFDRFEWGTNVKAWLFRIMINTHYNSYRRRKIFRDMEESSHGHWINMEVISQETMRALRNPESNLTRGIVLQEVQAAVEKLSDDYRTVFMLADIEGLSYKEVAETVGCPVGTVMSRLHRARRFLQVELLGADIFEEGRGGGAAAGKGAEDGEEKEEMSNVTPLRTARGGGAH